MQPASPVAHPIIRTYKGRDRRAAETAYRADARQAATAGWVPVAHRWTESWEGHELAVVFEQRTSAVLRSPAVAIAGAAAGAAAARLIADSPPVQPAGAEGSAEAEAGEGAGADGVLEHPVAAAALAGVVVGPEPDEDAEAEAEAGGAAEAAAPADDDADAPVLEEATLAAASPPGTPAGMAAIAAREREDADDADAGAPVIGVPVAGVAVAAEAGADLDDEAPVVAPLERAGDDAGTQPPVPETVTASRAHARAVLQTLDLHCAGEPLRLIRTGYPQVPEAPILERRRWILDNADWARRVLMYEPRGHRDMYGAILLPPYREDADIAVLFLHNAGASTMCGHGIIALTTGLIEERLYPATLPRTTIRFETPAGLVTATAEVTTGAHGGPEVRVVRFRNVPAFRQRANIVLDLPGVPRFAGAVARGGIRVDLAFGGAYYGIVDARELGLRVVPEQVEALTRAGAAITAELRRDHTPEHPEDADLSEVYGTIIVDTDPSTSPDGRATSATMRNVTIFADAEVDRSPCGSGTSALLAHLYAQGRLPIGRSVVNASITGEAFEGRVEAETTVGDHPAVITSVAGIGFVTGYASYLVDDRDPLGDGFLLR